MTALLYCIAQMLHMATEMKQNELATSEIIFKKYRGLLDGDKVENTFNLKITKLEDCSDAVDAFALYIKFYLRMHIQVEDPSFP